VAEKTTPAVDGWLSPGEAARELGLSVTRIHQLADKGRLVMQRTPLGRLISKASVEKMVQARRDIGIQ